MSEMILQAQGDFPFKFYIEKAQAVDEDNEMIITGVASTLNVDHDNERMSESALTSMAEVINEKSVPLRIEHDKSEQAVVGSVFKAWVDTRGQLWVKAILDKAHPASSILHKSLKEGVKLGLSVGGRVKKATKEFSEAVGNMVKTFYEVALDEVSVTQRPANYDAWLIAKSIVERGADVTKYYESPFYKEFLFENQQLDYMQAFAKSIPDKSWGKLTKDNKTIMDDTTKTEVTETEATKAEATETETSKTAEETKTEETATETTKATEETEETTKGFASKAELKAMKSIMTKGFEAITGLLSKMTTEAMDTTNPDTETKDPEVGKAEETETTEEAKKAEETTEETAEDEKAEGTETDTEDKYELKSIDKSIETIKNLTAKLNKTEETETEKEEETTKTAKGTSIDAFVEAITQYVEAVDEKFAKNGIRVPGSRQAIVDFVKSDKSLQSELKEMLMEPGLKKSVVMGVPYMTTKDGQKFSLVPVESKVQKSEKGNGKGFKEVYKESFASVEAE